MLITFKSDADGDVIMLGDVGQQMLAILGKDAADSRGIVTVDQLPTAIASLENAMQADRQAALEEARHGNKKDSAHTPADEHDDSYQAAGATIRLAQRAFPLLAMLRASLKETKPVIWEAR
ncbi:MAG: hypothetical protein CGU29_06065 [Candidatus Dactylopiibacterium carminicum]|uniref:DUF1840 domain-containing protein n=1 Tax=Candidatus Dactylopiibacterium carminicum TaxID=857335 RepID=A0A272EUL8_9RHOO|nr:DUF1840 domain-containing protein [Candidatus Dactylopiibacterium carminicum]KAF7600372.1 DUF1840 domain-containing protein [Candidatus Dactylopiibacterium carminicum]PAS93799.1 MAG: hypothetical protein CGU29_06065 [Candidatus Dactylopiibacterium carminicum]PAT00372.1 MAG: hypothetical protein BSR46_03080 [Candidatus Dactylopiibacterium carminicum]